MACSEFLGSGLLGMRQEQQNAINQLSGLQFVNNTFASGASARGLGAWGAIGGLVATKVLSIREELQAEISEWLPDL